MARTDVDHELAVNARVSVSIYCVQIREMFRVWINKYSTSILHGPEKNKTYLFPNFA